MNTASRLQLQATGGMNLYIGRYSQEKISKYQARCFVLAWRMGVNARVDEWPGHFITGSSTNE
jgi:hypothetical protein